MTTADAILLVRQFARNAGDSTAYSDTACTNAINIVGTRFVQQVRSQRVTTDITLTSGNTTATITTLTTLGFRPDMLLSVYLTNRARALDVVSWDDLQLLRSTTGRTTLDPTDGRSTDAVTPASGTPTTLAFETFTGAEVYPVPDAAYTLRFRWCTPFSLTGGSGGAISIPDDWLRQILYTGATAVLQHNEPESAYASGAWQKYLEFERSVTATGNLGATSSLRSRLADDGGG